MNKHQLIIAQINSTVGDIDGNLQLIVDACAAHKDDASALVVYPELALTGYPPEDLLSRSGFISDVMQALDKLVELSKQWQCSLLVGSPWLKGELLFNAALLIAGGEVKHVHCKNSLPNYGVFDERRYFAQGSAPVVVEHLGQKLGILICEDGWFEHNIRLLRTQQAEHVIVINASPFEAGKQQQRLEYFGKMAKAHSLDITYVNMAGAQDDLVFDGASFVMGADGEVSWQAAAFESCVIPSPVSRHGVNSAEGSHKAAGDLSTCANALAQDDVVTPYPDDIEAIYLAVSSGLKNYMHKNGLKRVVLGLSGGIDSALVATIAADALGAENVHGVLLPSTFTSDDSNIDALKLAKNLGIQTSTVPIAGFVDAAGEALIENIKRITSSQQTLGSSDSEEDPGLHQDDDALENWQENLAIGGNLQARFRGNILMAYSNALGGVLLNTSNKSEIAVGYSTLYGDSCGAYSPLKDVYKMQVYALSHWRNNYSSSSQRKLGPCENTTKLPEGPSVRWDDGNSIIPEAIINKAPTAELKPNQQDSDQLPDYEMLDKILHALIEEKMSAAEVIALGFEKQEVEKIANLLRLSEYKRRQAPPGPKVSSMLFGKDWRYPLSHRYQF